MRLGLDCIWSCINIEPSLLYDNSLNTHQFINNEYMFASVYKKINFNAWREDSAVLVVKR